MNSQSTQPSGKCVVLAPVRPARNEIEEAIVRIIEREVKTSLLKCEDSIKTIAQRESLAILSEAANQLRSSILDTVMGAVESEAERQVAKRIPPLQVIEIQQGTQRRRRSKRFSAPHHKILPDVIRIASARRADGFPVPLWLYGPPAAGKNVIAEQTALALDVPFYLISLGPTSTEVRMVGFQNLVNGQFVPGLLYEPFRSGGVAYLDEIDVTDPGVLVGVNALVSGASYRFANDEVVKRHPDFFVMAGANTDGSGPSGGFTRNKMDSAFLNRFVRLKVDYDNELEANLCGNPKWAEYVQKVRDFVKRKVAGTYYITPRATLNGAALLANGVRPSAVVDTVLLAGIAEEVKRTIIREIGDFRP